MSNHQVTAWGELSGKPLDGGRARGRIEIDHDIAAENHVLPWKGGIFGLENIDPLEAQALLEFGLDSTGAGSHTDTLLKITPQQFRWHRLDSIQPVNTLLSLAKHSPGDIRGSDLPVERGTSA